MWTPVKGAVVDDGLDAGASMGVDGFDQSHGGGGFLAGGGHAVDGKDDPAPPVGGADAERDEVVADDGAVVADVELGVGVLAAGPAVSLGLLVVEVGGVAVHRPHDGAVAVEETAWVRSGE